MNPLTALAESIVADATALFGALERDAQISGLSLLDPEARLPSVTLSQPRRSDETAMLLEPQARRAPIELDAIIAAAASRHGVDAALVKAVIHVESNFVATAVSPKGAQGLMQLMPATARRVGVIRAFDPAMNVEGGVKLLRLLLDRYGGDVTKTLAAYNAGEGAVARYGGVPPYPETRAYVQRVLGYRERYERGLTIARR